MTLNHKSAILGFAAAAAALVTPVRADPFTASGGPGSFDSYTSWTQGVLANVQLAAGTSDITSLTSSAVAYDQGWGGYDPQDNQVYIGLFNRSFATGGVKKSKSLISSGGFS